MAKRCLKVFTLILIFFFVAGMQQSKSSRLVLKDGTYELVGQYDIKGDKVRYFSMERHVWEEMPASLVDWEATRMQVGVASEEASARQNEALERAAKEKSEEAARIPTVAPGLRLPSPDGVYLVDEYQGIAEVNALVQNGADLNKNLGKNIMRGVLNPVAGSRQTVELNGAHARVQSHIPQPAIYVSIDTSDPAAGYSSQAAGDHLRLVRCEENKGNRIVVAFNIAVYGKVSQKAQYLSAKVEAISENWAKVTPVKPLEPGEYALIELDDKDAMNQFVWDFGFDPGAPPNLSPVQPSLERKEPVLILKPHKPKG
jgi:hypothetical protein